VAVRRLIPVGVALTAWAPAWAWDSEPVELWFTDAVDVFDALSFDSGVLPAGSPVGVRVVTASFGGASTEIEATSELWWPDALTHELVGYPEGGWFALDTDLSLAVSLVLDLSVVDLGVVEVPVWSDGVSFSGETTFDGLLLPGDGPNQVAVSSAGEVLGPFSTTLNLFTGVSVAFNAQAAPVATATLTGWELATDGAVIDSVDQLVHVEIPADPWTEHSTEWVGELVGSLDLVVTPSADLCISIIGCTRLVSFDIPIGLAEYAQERRLLQAYTHPLPLLGELPRVHDFGEVLVGTTANLELPFDNSGELPVQGEFVVEGGAAFRVFPDQAYALAQDEDGVVLSFSPTEVGQQSALLRVTTSDPAQPALTIPVSGVGVLPAPVDPGGEGGESVRVSSCGCAQAPAPLAAWWLAPVLGWAARRRRVSAPGG
jgi:hypothetical protein